MILWARIVQGLLVIVAMAFLSGTSAAQNERGTPTPTPTITPTLGPIIRRTPSPAAKCPQPTGKKAELSGEFYDKANPDLLRTDSFLKYLNTTGSAEGLKTVMASAFNPNGIKFFLTDVTGDHVPDVVVSLSPGKVYLSYFFILGCRDGQWATLEENTFADQGMDLGLDREGIQAIHDLNGNGVAEIVYSVTPNIGTHGYGWREYHVIEWDGQRFVPLLDPVEAWPREKKPVISVFNAARFSIRPHGSRTYELAFNIPASKYSHYGGIEAERNKEIVYAWNGAAFTRFCWRYTQPAKYIADAVMDGDNETSCKQYAKAMLAYQSAIFDNGLFPWAPQSTMSNGVCCAGGFTTTPTPSISNERAILSAYARYRIILLHLVQNRPNEAKTDYNILQKRYPTGAPGTMFAQLAATFWEAYSAPRNLRAGCQGAIAYAVAHDQIKAFFDEYELGIEISVPAFALSEDITQICPFK